MQQHKDVETVLLTHSDIIIACEQIAQRINQDYKGKKPVLICVLKGGAPYCSELMQHLDMDIELDFIKVTSYNGSSTKGEVHLISDITFNVENRDVIVVDDILDTGFTVSFVVKHLLKKNVKSIEVTTLLDKPALRKRDVDVKYIGYKVPNRYLVGFGLDWSEQYRALPYVAMLKREVYEKEE